MTVGGPSALVTQAAQFRVDVYGAGVACDGPRVADGAGAPATTRLFASGDKIELDLSAGTHTVQLTTFSAAMEVTGVACATGTWSGGTVVCLDLTLAPPPDLSVCSGAACPCLVDDDCAPGRYCAQAQSQCLPGCRKNDDCAPAPADGGEPPGDGGAVTVALPVCAADSHVCVACATPADCARPPACQANFTIAYPGTSPCVKGACIYPPPTIARCPLGCYQGACTSALASIGMSAAFEEGTQTPVPLVVLLGAGSGGGPASPSKGVTIRTQVSPRGSARAVTLQYFLNGNFGTRYSVPMAFEHYVAPADEQYSAVLPAQPAGTQVYFYVEADSYDSSVGPFYSPGMMKNFSYISN
jgi:hypothetical protein